MNLFWVMPLKRILSIAAVVTVVVLTVTLATALPTAEASRRIPIYEVEDDGCVAITFDAAWGADKTRLLADTLHQRSIRATFFLTGFWIEAHPDLVLYLHEKGMEIANHSVNHYHMGEMSAEECLQEIQQVNSAVFSITGVQPRLFRAPFGEYSNTLIETLDRLGMRCIQWNVDSLDWKGLSAQQLTERVLARAAAGSIILCHNNSDHIGEALPTVLDQLTAKGYRFVTVSQLLEGKEGTIDPQGKLHA